MKTTVGKLRNVTTGILHTDMDDVYEFFNDYVSDGIMTHHLPSAQKALRPILEGKLDESYFNHVWQKEFLDEEVEIAELTIEEKAKFWEAFQTFNAEMWSKMGSKK